MIIVYADDDHVTRRVVCRALQTRGYTVFTLDTSSSAQLQQDTASLLQLTATGIKLDILVLDGHNVLDDEQGRPLLDVTPLGLLNWLRKNDLAQECQLILYSNDNQMVKQAKQQLSVQFAASVCKIGEGGGLQGLLDSIEQVKQSLRPTLSNHVELRNKLLLD